MPDLWPEKLDDVGDSLPVTPIKEQAELLAKRTGNLVIAEVVPLTPQGMDQEGFPFDFDLVIPTMDYRFTLFTFTQGVEGYPVVFKPYSKICRRQIDAPDEESLLNALGQILGSNTTKKILQNLMAQAKKFKAS